MADVVVHLGLLFPRALHQPVDVVAHDGRFGRHRRHQLELVELGHRLVARFLRHAGLLNALLELRELVRRVLDFAQLLLNGLHLLIQVVLALALLHLLLDAAADALFDLQHIHLAFDQREDVFETFAHVLDLEHLLLGIELERHVRGDGVGEATRLLDAGERGQDFRRHLAIELHVLLELRDDRTRQHVHLALVVLLDVLERADLGGEVLAGDQLLDLGALDAFDQHLDRAVRQLQQLQNRRDGAEAIQILRTRIVDVGLLLRDQQDLLARAHRLVERENRFLAADEQRNDHVRIHDHVAQRQHRHRGGGRRAFGFGSVSAHARYL